MNMYKSTRAYTSKPEQYYIQQFASACAQCPMTSCLAFFTASLRARCEEMHEFLEEQFFGNTNLWKLRQSSQESKRRIIHTVLENLLKYCRNNALTAAEMLHVSFGLVLVSSSNTLQKLVENMSVPQLG